MSDTENVRKRLLEFIEAVWQKASGIGSQARVSPMHRAGPPKTEPIEDLVENCVAALTDEERDEFDRLIEKMQRALKIRPGAIPQIPQP
jgi:hypothetical protein